MIAKQKPASRAGSFLGLVASLAIGLTTPAAAQPPGAQASLQDFRQTCAQEIANWAPENLGFYTSFISRSGLPGGSANDLASPDELRRKHADMMRELQRLASLFPADRVQAGGALNMCMLRVALRHATDGATSQSAASSAAAPRVPAQGRPNPGRLTEAMIAPCNDWLAIRIARYNDEVGTSNLEFALSTFPYSASIGVYNLTSTRMFIAEREREIPILLRHDEAGMRATIGMVLRGAEYWDRLALDYRFLCMLYVRRQQLTGQAFSQAIPTPAAVGYPRR